VIGKPGSPVDLFLQYLVSIEIQSHSHTAHPRSNMKYAKLQPFSSRTFAANVGLNALPI
jgi:hypothetical protein